MADDADRAQDLIEQRTADALAVRKEPGPVECGFCHACGEAIGPGLRFCGPDCRNLWQELHDRGMA